MIQDEINRPAGVTGATQPKQAGDIDRWWWIETSVWTERMLKRLERSEPTTVWFGLWDKVHCSRNLQAAFWAVWRNKGAPGVDGQTVPQFDAEQEAELAKLGEELRNRRYHRQPARRVWIPKPGWSWPTPFTSWAFGLWPLQRQILRPSRFTSPAITRSRCRSCTNLHRKAAT